MKKKGEMKKVKKVKDKVHDGEHDDPWWWLILNGIKPSFLCISIFALLVRFAVGLHPYSGANTPPKFGDYEAQRHWMEITLNLPPKDWYRNSSVNDLSYWGLDYPPLTAYQSYIHGVFLKTFDPDSVALFTSRGYESYIGNLLMRWTVLSSDVLIFFPAALYFVFLYSIRLGTGRNSDVAWHISMVLLNPCLILIDHGHFQYNCISLGLTMAAIAAALSQKDLVASVLYCLALNHKQMSAYFAPAFFSYLLGKCLKNKNPLVEVTKLGLMVIGTFAVVWWPYLQSKEAALAVLSRLAPFERGIYEDYVANFWCTSSVLVKWKKLYTTQSLRIFSLTATLLTCLPSMVQQVHAPSSKGFLYALLNSSFSFYLFSYQVHEKSILLPLLPLTLLALEERRLLLWLTHFAMFSLLPLLHRDKLILPYMALYSLFIVVYFAPGGPGGRCNESKTLDHSQKKTGRGMEFISFITFHPLLMGFLGLCSLILHVIYLTMHPPNSYPFLFEAVIMLICFSQFVLFTLYFNSKQWMLSKHLTSKDNQKKLI
ncbi:putative dolichyl pyrophosphate Man9GlcNAc2 alpha-1,3-glucosyltransferase [Hibiscus syriacus]|uniref:Alpha-1,3-glucosyltransferase n=1 Tax=Hibiscus syriacus TaxID=106335 RepID=A0A6A2XKH6_HIBSY|nr:probable dolichyl pyrophosphate Man9GlcNAc2 alpha-1,3-glucosyltransferase [Hibiscus syriacus]KAE8670300.1 putative dolichyl pyrophosphate Man9GlcNAc2 alpha-1,3-glucosyltransferase [Hibiscus syriacus]